MKEPRRKRRGERRKEEGTESSPKLPNRGDKVNMGKAKLKKGVREGKGFSSLRRGREIKKDEDEKDTTGFAPESGAPALTFRYILRVSVSSSLPLSLA